MSLLDRLFGRGKKKTFPAGEMLNRSDHPADDPNLIRVFDKYGHEMFITREDWRDSILMGNIEQAWNKPDELYGLIVQSLQDEFVEEIVPASEQLHRIDYDTARGATILGIAYMETGRLDEAEQVLSGHLSKHGKSGIVLTNLAKVYAQQGFEDKSLQTLWEGLEVDPNQDNGMGWYEVIHREKGGEQAGLDALRRVAELPGSWRAQLWLARAELEDGNLEVALGYYRESLKNAGHPVPADLLKQMSGDLGNSGHLNEITEWVGPLFDAQIHGIMVGNNLLKANIDLGNLDAARTILDGLYALKHPDWRETLSFWDNELGQARIQQVSEPPRNLTMMSIKGPLWMRDGSPFASLLSDKNPGAPVIGVLGSTASYKHPSDECIIQLADGPGRLCRAVPLVMAEQLHLKTNAGAHALIPVVPGSGFAQMATPYSEANLRVLATRQELPMDYIVYVTLDTVSEPWRIEAIIIRVSDGAALGKKKAAADSSYPGPGVQKLLAAVHKLVVKKTSIKAETYPEWYQLPTDRTEYSDYLRRLEQLLAVNCTNLDYLEDAGLSGEREILDGSIQLCARNPDNPTARMLLVQTLRQMRKARPDIMPEFKDKIESLQREFPIIGNIGDLASTAIAEVFLQ